MQIEHLKQRIKIIAETLRSIEAKIVLYSDKDWLATEAYIRQYMALDAECIDLIIRLKELEDSTPPDHTHLDGQLTLPNLSPSRP